MGLDLVTVGYGRPAADALRGHVAASKADDPLAPVTVVVPTNYVGISMRRQLAQHGGGIAAVSFLTLYRLAELLGSPRLAAAGRRPVSTPVLGAAVRAVLAERPGIFAPVADHPATEQALLEAHRLLADVSPEALDALAAAGPRADEVVRVHRAVRQRLATSWYDEHDLTEAAIEVVQAGSPVVDGLGTVIVHLPQEVSRAAGRLVKTVAATTDVVVLAGVTGSADADAGVARSVERLGGDGAAVRRASDDASPPVAAAVVSVSDGEEEVRAAVRRIVADLRAGVPLERMALLYASREPYARLVHQHLTAAGIPWNGTAVRSIGDGLVGRTLRALLALPDHGFRRQDVLALLAHAPIRDGGRLVPTSAWERVSRAAGVVGGPSDWDVRLRRFAAGRRSEAEVVAADGQERRAAHLRSDADHADNLRAFVAALVDDLSGAAPPKSWAARVAWAQRLLHTLLGGDTARRRWPNAEIQAAHKVEAALERLGSLDRVDPTPPTLDVFRRTLDLELDADLERVGRFGDGLLVGHVGLAVGLDLDRVHVLGLAEGAFPARRLDDSLLPDRERERAGGELDLRGEGTHREHRQLLAAIAGANGAATLGFPRGDLRRTGERVASRWLLDTATALAGRDRLTSDELGRLHDEPWFEEVPSFAAGLARTGFPATGQDHRLCGLLGHERSGGGFADSPLRRADPILDLGADLTLARRSASFTRFDGDLSAVVTGSPTDESVVVSPTRLEAWAACPHAYFVRYVLGVEPVESPERLLDLSALDRGSITHEALDRFVREVLDRPPAEQPGPDDRWTDADRARLAAIGEEVFAAYEAAGLTGKPVFRRRSKARILRDLDLLLSHDDEVRAAFRSSPVASELGFGVRGAVDGPLEVKLSDGRVLRFRGSADRVDRTADGGLVVIDYKTGSPEGYAGLSAETPDTNGTHLQLPVYALAARRAHGSADTPVHAAYWFVTEKRRFEWIGYEVTDQVAERFDEVLRTIVDGIAGGVFVPHPEAPRSFRLFVECVWCDPDGMGTADRRREWEQVRDDPRLAAYRGLAEPEDTLV